jgi:hypothetical protein
VRRLDAAFFVQVVAAMTLRSAVKPPKPGQFFQKGVNEN